MKHSLSRAGLVLHLVAGTLSAQTANSGILQGRITSAGVPVPQAELLVMRLDGFTERRAVASSDGSFRVAFLPPGTYRLTVRRIGFQPVIVHDLLIRSGRVETLAVTLEPAAVRLDSLVVLAAAVRISTSETEFGSRLTASELALLPLPSDARELVAFTPGARPDQIWGAATGQANNYQLDGVSVNHPGLGGDFLQPSTSWIEEIEVRGLGAGAEYGNFQGGLVNIVTRSGGNRVQGSLRTSGESWHLNGTNLRVTESGSEPAHRVELDGQLRGPLLRDRLFYAVFGQVVDRGSRVLNKVRQVNGEFVPSRPAERERKFLAKLTWHPAPGHIVNGSLGRIDADADQFGQNGFQRGEATLDRAMRTLFGSLSWQRSFSAGSFLELRVAGFDGSDRRAPYAGEAVPGIATLLEVNPRIFQNAPFRELREPSSLALSANWDLYARFLGADHHLKIGGEHGHGGWNFTVLRNGGLTWRPGDRLTPPAFDPQVPSTWVFNQAMTSSWGGEARLQSRVENSAVYVQDYIRINAWLAINPGLRAGRWIGRLRRPDGNFFTPVRDHAIEPRIGVVADLSGNATLVAKAHWGIYHQNMFAAFFDRAEGGAVYSNEERWEYRGAPFTDPRTTFTTAERDADPAWTRAQTIRLNEVGRVENFKEPYIEQGILGLEKTWGGRIKTEALFVHRRNRNMVAVVDRNIADNYTVFEQVSVLDRFFAPLFFGGQPLVLPRIAVSNEDIIYWREQVLSGNAIGPDFKPPGMSTADWLALTYEPDNVLTNVPEATRRFDQLQLTATARYPTWWAQASATLTRLEGNLNSLTGTDDYSISGAGPFVRLNEQINFFGDLNNQSGFELKLRAGGNLPWHFRGGVFLTHLTGDKVTPTLTLSDLLLEFQLPDTASTGAPPARLRGFYFATTAGQRIFIEPRGTYRHSPRTALDFHLERAFARGGAEFILALDAFNALGASSVTAIQTSINGNLDPEAFTSYGQTLQRVPPRTLRVGAEIRF